MTKPTKADYEHVKKNLQLLYIAEKEAEDDEHFEETVKAVVCPFFKEGDYPSCRTCFQPSEALSECTTLYRDSIEKQPMQKWGTGFGIARSRDVLHSIAQTSVGMSCDSCYLSDNCAVYEQGAQCGIDWSEGFDSKEPDAIVDHLIQIQNERINRARLVEKVDGGVPDATLSTEMDRLTGLIAQKQDLKTNKFRLSIEGSSSGDNSQSAGILSQVFGGMIGSNNKEESSSEEIIDITPSEEPTKKRVRGKKKV